MPYNKSEKRRATKNKVYNKSDEKRDSQHSERKLIRDRRHFTPLQSVANKKTEIAQGIDKKNVAVQQTFEKTVEKQTKRVPDEDKLNKLKNPAVQKPLVEQAAKKKIILPNKASASPHNQREPVKKSVDTNTTHSTAEGNVVVRKIDMQVNNIMASLFFEYFDLRVFYGFFVLLFISITTKSIPAIFFFGYAIFLAVQGFKTYQKIKNRAIKMNVMDNGDLILYYKNADMLYKKLIKKKDFIFEIKLVPKKNHPKKTFDASLKMGNQKNQIVIFDKYKTILRIYLDLLETVPEKNIRHWEYENLRKVMPLMDRIAQDHVYQIIDRYKKQRKS